MFWHWFYGNTANLIGRIKVSFLIRGEFRVDPAFAQTLNDQNKIKVVAD